MRRGGRLFLLLGIVVAAVAALVLFVVLNPGTSQNPPPESLVPTVEPKNKIVGARIDIPNNAVLSDTETFLQLADIPEGEFNAAGGQFFTSISDVQDKVTLRAIPAT